MIHYKHLLLALTASALLFGCSTGVPLDEPVDESSAIRTSPPGGDANATAESAVPGVDLGPAQDNSAGPQGVGRIVYFDFDSYVLRPEAQPQIEAHARYLNAVPQRRVQIDGHTDDRGGREYNLALGQKRAEAVRRALALLGVRDAQMEAVSYGKEQPAVDGYTEEAHAKNRRAELNYR